MLQVTLNRITTDMFLNASDLEDSFDATSFSVLTPIGIMLLFLLVGHELGAVSLPGISGILSNGANILSLLKYMPLF